MAPFYVWPNIVCQIGNEEFVTDGQICFKYSYIWQQTVWMDVGRTICMCVCTYRQIYTLFIVYIFASKDNLIIISYYKANEKCLEKWWYAI